MKWFMANSSIEPVGWLLNRKGPKGNGCKRKLVQLFQRRNCRDKLFLCWSSHYFFFFSWMHIDCLGGCCCYLRLPDWWVACFSVKIIVAHAMHISLPKSEWKVVRFLCFLSLCMFTCAFWHNASEDKSIYVVRDASIKKFFFLCLHVDFMWRR